MKKIIASVLVILCIFACKEEQTTLSGTETQTSEEYLAKNKLNIPKKGKLQELAPNIKKLVQDWLEFNAIHENMKLINSSNRFSIPGDLGQLAANIDVIQQKKFPKDLDAMQIHSRFLVLKTKALKLQDDATDDNISNDFIEKEIVAMNQVFNSVCYQIVQASQLNIDPEEILGDAMKLKDTINNVEEETIIKKVPVPKIQPSADEELLPGQKEKRSKKSLQKKKSQNN